jgi:hypothetical protein
MANHPAPSVTDQLSRIKDLADALRRESERRQGTDRGTAMADFISLGALAALTSEKGPER